MWHITFTGDFTVVGFSLFVFRMSQMHDAIFIASGLTRLCRRKFPFWYKNVFNTVFYVLFCLSKDYEIWVYRRTQTRKMNFRSTIIMRTNYIFKNANWCLCFNQISKISSTWIEKTATIDSECINNFLRFTKTLPLQYVNGC